MRDPPRILIVDDNEHNRAIIAARLSTKGYSIAEACDGVEALEAVRGEAPDLILLDVTMPRMDGLEACRRLKDDASLGFIPVILVTALSDTKDVIVGLEAGADEYLTKPIDQPALLARVRSMLRIKELQDRTKLQATELAAWNDALERRVAEQLVQIERASRLKRFLPPQVADLIQASPTMEALESHRREITVVFCDLRGFTAFAEAAEPEEVMAVLKEYHSALGALIHEFEGTLERFVGDGVLVLFNDPIPCQEPCLRAARMAAAMRARLKELSIRWRASGHTLGFGVGIAHGYATLGPIGFEGRSDYAAIGTVVNLAARLCARQATDAFLSIAKCTRQSWAPRIWNRRAISSSRGYIGSWLPSTFTLLRSRKETVGFLPAIQQMTALRPIAVGCGKKGNFRFGSDLTRSPVFAECPVFAHTGRLESAVVLKNPPRPARADSGCDGDQGGRFEPFASCGEDRRRKGDELRQFPRVLGSGRQ